MEAVVASKNGNGHVARDPDRDPPRGVYCPACWCTWVPVYCTKPILGKVRQYRRCEHCKRAFITTISNGVK